MLAPVLAAQAVLVRRRAQFLPEPPGPRAGRSGAGRPLRLLIAGDSSAAGVGAPHQDQALAGQLVALLARHFEVTWRLEAVTGATTASMLDRLASLPEQRFDVAVTALGVNDVTRASTEARWRARQGALLDLLRDRFGAGAVFATGLPPMRAFPLLPEPLAWVLGAQAERLDKALASLCDSRSHAHHVRIAYPPDPGLAASDGYHPTPRAYGIWAGEMAARILATTGAAR